MQDKHILQLPINVIGRVDVGRMIREIDALDSFFEANSIREPGTQPKLPRTSKLMDETIQLNKLNILLPDDRKRLADFLRAVRTDAPVLHMSFSADPSPLFTQKLITWLRGELHPLVLLQIGLQPSIGAGCVVRTTNKYFDFSLKKRFSEKHDLLMEKMRNATPTKPVEAVTQEVAS